MDISDSEYKITVLIPCKNEEAFIGKVLDNVVSQDVNKSNLEVFVIDGRSSDRTREIIHNYSVNHQYIKLLDNPDEFVPHGLNKGIAASTGTCIIRMDAHSEYPENYISQLSYYLNELDAANVGGYWKILPGDSSLLARAIAIANESPVGTGGASYRMNHSEITEVDTVPYGCYSRSVIDQVGMFDTDLIRNQDDEMNARIRKHGGRIYLLPDLEIKYYARKTVGKTIKMFFQYGLFKPLVNQKLGKLSSLRQLVPMILVSTLIFFAITSFFSPAFLIVGIIIIGTYILSMFVLGLLLALRKNFIAGIILLPMLFIIIHLSYGWGYLNGLILLAIGKKPGVKSNSR